MKTKTLLTIATFCTFLLSCNINSDQKDGDASRKTPNNKADIKSIEDVYLEMALAYKTYDITLIEKIYTEDAFNIYCGDTSDIKHLRKNFIDGFQRTFNYHKEKETKLDLKFKIVHREIDINMAYDVGYFRIDKTDKQGVITKGNPGKFVTILKKQKDNTWKFQVDIYGDAPARAFTP